MSLIIKIKYKMAAHQKVRLENVIINFFGTIINSNFLQNEDEILNNRSINYFDFGLKYLNINLYF